MNKLYVVSEELLKEIQNGLAWIRNFRGPNVTNTARGATFSLPASGGRTPQQMGGGSTVTQFRFKEEFENYIRCVTWDGTMEGTVDYFIAKPVRHRGSATSGYYTSNDIIYAARCSGKTDVLDGTNKPIYWIDLANLLPAGTGDGKVLQLNSSNVPYFDYPRIVSI